MTRRALFLLLGVALAGALHSKTTKTPSATQPVIMGAEGTSVENAARATMAERLAESHVQPAPPSADESHIGTVRRLRDVFAEMKATRGLVISDDERRRLASTLVDDPAVMATVRTVLEEPDGATRLFAEGQAEVRHYAIEVVREASRRGRPELALDMAVKVAREVKDGTNVLAGRTLDIESLVSAYAEGLGTTAGAARAQAGLERFGDRSRWSPELEDAIGRGLFDGFWRTSDAETARQLADQLLVS